MTVNEAATRLNIGAQSVLKEIRLGNLAASRVGPGGRRWHVTPAAIDAYLAARRYVPEGQGTARGTARGTPAPAYEPVPDRLGELRGKRAGGRA